MSYKYFSCSKPPVTLFIDPAGEQRLDPLAALCLQWFCPRTSKEIPLILLVMLRIGRMFIHVGGGEDPGVLLSPLVVMMKIYQSESCP